MKLRIATLTATLATGAMLLGPGAALAANPSSGTTGPAGTTPSGTTAPATSLKNIPVTATDKNGKAVTGTLTVTHFAQQHGKLVAIGTVHIGGKTKKNVAFPVLRGAPATTSQAAVCRLLHLVLGPIHLNLLGLHLDTKVIDVNLTAVPGPGNLLGNLLCSVSNLLNGPTALPPGPLANLLNGIQGLLAGLGL